MANVRTQPTSMKPHRGEMGRNVKQMPLFSLLYFIGFKTWSYFHLKCAIYVNAVGSLSLKMNA